jgi:hypothetical protein
LVQLMLNDTVPLPATEPARSEYIQARLNSNVHDDFKNAHIVVIKGWVLSITEARQCALLSLPS